MKKLILLTTPIGNRFDITGRVIDALKTGTVFFAEDTRVAKSLFKDLEIPLDQKIFESFHDHSDHLLEKMVQKYKGLDIYYLSDAGSPVISDPALPLVRYAYENSIEVESFSGISAVNSALELSGLPANPYSFYGFLPKEEEKKKKKFASLFAVKGTYIFFESPHRILKTLNVLKENFPEVDVAVCRELTKTYQSVYRFKAKECESIEITTKGEFVLIVYIDEDSGPSLSSDIIKLAENYVDKKSSPKNLAKLLGEILDRPSKEIYQSIIKK